MLVKSHHHWYFIKASFLQNFRRMFSQKWHVIFRTTCKVLLNRRHKGQSHVFTCIFECQCLWSGINNSLRSYFSQKFCKSSFIYISNIKKIMTSLRIKFSVLFVSKLSALPSIKARSRVTSVMAHGSDAVPL